MENNKSVRYEEGKFKLLEIYPNLQKHRGDNLPFPVYGTLTVPGDSQFALKSWEANEPVKEYDPLSGGNHELRIKTYEVVHLDDGPEAYYRPIFEDSGVDRIAHFHNAPGYDSEVSLQNKEISVKWDDDLEPISRDLPYKTTVEQLGADFNMVPYLELTVSANGFVTGGLARLIHADTGNTVRANPPNNELGLRHFELEMSVDGTGGNTRWLNFPFRGTDGYDFRPGNGQPINVDVNLPRGLEGVIRADRVISASLSNLKFGGDEYSHRWQFFNEDFKELEVKAEVGADNETEMVVVGVDLEDSGFAIPDLNEETRKGVDAKETTVVTSAMANVLSNNEVRLVKATEFEASYIESPDGSQVLPTIMRFNARRADIGEKVWENITKVPDDQEEILKHLNIYKIIPIINRGTRAINLMYDNDRDIVTGIDKKDWLKVFTASIDMNEEEVNITANIMIRDDSVPPHGAAFEGIKQFGNEYFIMYVDGRMNGKFEDPIALVSYETEPTTTSPSGGCNTASGLALLALLPLIALAKRKDWV